MNRNINIFDADFWGEILQTIKSQKGRSLMTAFGVFWGIFMLTLLIGAGMGLDNGVAGRVKSMPANLLWLVPKETTMPYKGFGRDRKWKMGHKDELEIRRRVGNGVDYVSAICFADFQNVSCGEQTYQYQVLGVTPEFYGALPQRVLEGRFIDDIDILEHRKVCVIGLHIAEVLFDNIAEATGRIVEVNGMPLKVVGVSKTTNEQINIGVDLSESVFMPLPTEQAAYGRGDEIDAFVVILKDSVPVAHYRSQIENLIKENNSVHPDDQLALTSVTLGDMLVMYKNIFTGINLLIWIIGLGTLMAGLIGISNIMLVTVKERTQEIGIRRALGAQPANIVTQIMMESLVLTMGAGLAGLSMGVWLLSFAGRMLPEGESLPFTNPYMPFWTALASLLIIVAGGLFAGWLPTKRALQIKPIDALREE